MTQFYELTDRNAASCNFAGNASVNTGAPSSRTAVDSAVSQCLSNTAATFTPTAPSNDGGSGSGGNTGGNGGTSSPRPSQSNNAAIGTMQLPVEGVFGATFMMIVATLAGAFTLA